MSDSKKVMRLVDEKTGKMVCKVCGASHLAQINPETGKYHRANWKCPNGCKLPDDGEGKQG